jgi:hypothetical protein
MSKIDKLPTLGKVSLPVHIMHHDNKKHPEQFFQSGFAFFAVADDQADVSNAEGKNIGSLGSCMGGHYQVDVKKEDEDFHVIINVEDIWREVTKLLDSDKVKLQFEGMEETYKKYWDEKQKTEKLEKEIKQMQKDAEAEVLRKEEENKNKAIAITEKKRLAEEAKLELKARKLREAGKQFGDILIVDDNGWNLNEELPDQDWMFKEDFKIPVDFGMGVKTTMKGDTYTYKRNPRKKPTVTLEISTWKGMGADAIHYYGKLNIDLPDMERDDQPGHTCSISGFGGIPMYSNSQIELTQILEQWEIDKYPRNYKHRRPGEHNRGFYAVEGVKRRGKEVFEKLFGEGWTLKIDKRF